MGKLIKTFEEMTKADFQEAGGKAANLGELSQGGFNVPPGCCVTSEALFHHIEENGLQDKIDQIAASFDYEEYSDLDKKCKEIRDFIYSVDIPNDLLAEIRIGYRSISDASNSFVAVRSSVAVKDSSVSSFPGMMDTYHYLKEEEEVIDHVKKCWASLWTTRAVMARHNKNIDHNLGLIAAIIQKMVHSEKAGVMFTANPITSERGEIVIEANWGLGESVVSGKSMNDFYVLGKSPLELKQKQISKKTLTIDFDEEKGYGRQEMAVESDRMDAPTLSEEEALELGREGIKIEGLFGVPQDIEWAYEKGELFILQSRDIRTLKDQAA